MAPRGRTPAASPSRADWWRRGRDSAPAGLVLTLTMAAAGGAALDAFAIPLGWLMGAMFVTTARALAGRRLVLPLWLRNTMVAVLGVMLGSGFSPELLNNLGRWAWTLSGLAPWLALVVALCAGYLYRVVGYDAKTALFAAYPGGFVEMVTIGGEMGADVRRIALIHSIRVLITVFSVPLWFRFVEGFIPPEGGAFGPGGSPLDGPDLLLLTGCAVAGVFAGRAVRMPGSVLMGPLILSGIVHVAGLTASRPPGELIVAAQIVVGAAVGTMFVGVTRRQLATAAAAGIGMVAVMLLTTFGFGALLAALTGLAPATVILAYAPGGLSEMGLVALALGIDVAFVATHHMVRMLLIVFTAPVAAAWLARRRRGP